MLVGEYKADLLPCPFCGRKPRHWENTVCDATIRCMCGVRMLRQKMHGEKDEHEGLRLIAKWNNRAGVGKTGE